MQCTDPILGSIGAAAEPPRIELRNVGLRYFTHAAETEAVVDLSLTVAAGEFVAIVGPSGCGKSTLLSLIAGLITPTRGEVLVEGKSVVGPSQRIGYMLQQDYLLEWRSVLDNVVLAAEIQRRDMTTARARAMALLRRYGLEKFSDSRPRHLSGGMRQRVALARTLLTEPSILLLDEPFSALDAQTRLSLADELASDLRGEGRTVILVTHDLAEAVSMADRVVVLSRRPATVKSEHAIDFGDVGRPRPSPLNTRKRPEFATYFDRLWQELDGHA